MAGREFPEGCALVIGGSGGIGSVVAQGFASAGTPVAITYRRNKDKADAVVKKIQAGGWHGELPRTDAERLRAG